MARATSKGERVRAKGERAVFSILSPLSFILGIVARATFFGDFCNVFCFLSDVCDEF